MDCRQEHGATVTGHRGSAVYDLAAIAERLGGEQQPGDKLAALDGLTPADLALARLEEAFADYASDGRAVLSGGGQISEAELGF